MARGAVVCYWASRGAGLIYGGHVGGHLGLSVEADAGRSWMSWWESAVDGSGIIKGMHEEFRQMTGAGNHQRNHNLAMNGTPRPGQVSTKDGPVEVKMGSQEHTFNQGQLIRLPDLVCEIPAINIHNNKLGLDVERMYYWCRSFAMANGDLFANKNIDLPYKTLSTTRNCCGAVLQALRIGGASYFRSKPFKTFFVTPKEVFWYAFRLAEAIDDLNKKNAAVQMSTAELSKKMRGLTVASPLVDLPTVEQWKAMSKVRIGARKEQILKIDRALTAYWLFKWPNDSDNSTSAQAQREEKALNLCTIIREAAEHAALKPTSDRKHAVAAILTLGWQVMKVRVRSPRHKLDNAEMCDDLSNQFESVNAWLTTDQFIYEKKPAPE